MAKPKNPQPRRFETTFWADDRVPDLTELLAPHAIDTAEFTEWLRPHMERYRSAVAERDLQVPHAEQVEWMQRFGSLLADTEHALRPSSMPPDAAARIFMVAAKFGHDWSKLQERAYHAIKAMRIIAAPLTDPAIKPPAAKRGAKNKAPRDELVAAVIDHLKRQKLTVVEARTLARHVLDACGIDLPGKTAPDEVDLGDALKKPEQRGKK